MIELHPEILKRNGSEYVVLPYAEFAALQDLLAEYEDLFDLRAAKRDAHGEPSTKLEDIKTEFGL